MTFLDQAVTYFVKCEFMIVAEVQGAIAWFPVEDLKIIILNK